MDSTLKPRLIGAAVLAALAIIFLPMLLKGPDVREADAAEVLLTMPAPPGQDFETRELPLAVPDTNVRPGGALGMGPGSAATPIDAATGLPVTDADAVADSDAVDATAGGSPANPQRVADGETPLAGPLPAPSAAPAPAALPGVAAAPAAVAAGNYMVNVGTFGDPANASALATRLRAAGLQASSERVSLASGTAVRLRVGPFADRASAEAGRVRAERIAGGSAKVVATDATIATPAALPARSVAPAVRPPATPAAVPPAAAAPAVATAVAPASPPPARASVAPPGVRSGFAVQVAAPSVEAEANALRDRARALGFNSFVQRVDTDAGIRYRVRMGPVADRSAAESLRDAVNPQLGTKGIVVIHP